MYRIVYKRPDGGISVVAPAPGRHAEEVAARAVPPNIEWKSVPKAEIPSDRYFRNAWELLDDSVTVDMERARDVQMEKIRAARDAQLRRLDLEQLKGSDVSAEKQRLRDLPETLDLSVADTPEGLKALWPDDIPR